MASKDAISVLISHVMQGVFDDRISIDTMLLNRITNVLFLLGIILGEATAQLTNVTIFNILNTTQLSPAYKFIQLITSSPSYQPIVDLLSNPGNITLFVPSDEVFDQMMQHYSNGNNNNNNQTQGNPGSNNNGTNSTTPGNTNNGTNSSTPGNTNNGGGGSGGGNGGANNNGTSSGGITNGVRINIRDVLVDNNNTATPPSNTNNNNTATPPSDTNNNNTATPPSDTNNNNNNNSSSNNTSTTSNESKFPPSNATYNDITLLDYIFYHILTERVTLNDQTNQTLIYQTFLNNITLDKFGYGVPVIINSNATTESNSSSENNGNGNQTNTPPSSPPNNNDGNQTNTPPPNGNNGNQTNTPPPNGNNGTASSWASLLSNLVDSNSNDTTTNSTTSKTPVFWIGNGLSFANVTIHDIEASNGILHVINNVLMPPENLTSVFSNATNNTSLENILSQNQTLNQSLNNVTNITIFASNSNNLNNMDIEQLKSIYANQSVEGIYFTTNFTNQGSSGGDNNTNAPITLNTFAGGNISVQVNNNNNITLNDNINIVKPNILFSGGVIHLIDRELGSPSNNSTPTTGNPNQPTSSGNNQPTSTANNQPTSSANNQPTSSANNQPTSSANNQPTPSNDPSQQPPPQPQPQPQEFPNDGGNPQGSLISETPDDNSPFELVNETTDADDNNNQPQENNPLENEPLPFSWY
ncbi:unnamed protein product [Cunninghamella echinulata]